MHKIEIKWKSEGKKTLYTFETILIWKRNPFSSRITYTTVVKSKLLWE